MSTHSSYYIQNQNYSDFLENQSESSFQKYILEIQRLVSPHSTFLDVGCGTGIVVDALCDLDYKASGVEISDTSLELAQKKKGEYKQYDGSILPYTDSFFDAVGSFNVLEHTENPVAFLDECLRVTRKDGYVFICTPNFLSLTNSYHYRVAGVQRKISNAFIIAQKAFRMINASKVQFDSIEPVVHEPFQPDDDAIALTNPFDILLWGKLRNLTPSYFSGSTMPEIGLKKILASNVLTRYIMGSVFIIFKK